MAIANRAVDTAYSPEMNNTIANIMSAAVSYGTINAKGEYEGFLAFSHVEIEIDSAENIRDCVKNSSKAQM